MHSTLGLTCLHRWLVCLLLCTLLVVAACTGGGGGGSDPGGTAGTDGFGRHSVAFTNEQSDVGHVFVTGRDRGLVTLRRAEGPVIYFMLGDGRMARFQYFTEFGDAILETEDAAIEWTDIDADGQMEVTVTTASGSTTYEAEDMQQGDTTTQEQSLLGLEDLERARDEAIDFFRSYRHAPLVDWSFEKVSEIKDAVDTIDQTISEWADTDSQLNDSDRELFVDGTVEVPETTEEPTVVSDVHQEAHDRIAGNEPQTNYLGDNVSEKTGESSVEPAEWSNDNGAGVPCVIQYKEGPVMALVEQTCVASAQDCTALGGDAYPERTPSGCQEWCNDGLGVILASADPDGSNLMCYPQVCVDQAGQNPTPSPLRDAAACDAGCQTDLCDSTTVDPPTSTESWVRATFSGGEDTDNTPKPSLSGYAYNASTDRTDPNNSAYSSVIYRRIPAEDLNHSDVDFHSISSYMTNDADEMVATLSISWDGNAPSEHTCRCYASSGDVTDDYEGPSLGLNIYDRTLSDSNYEGSTNYMCSYDQICDATLTVTRMDTEAIEGTFSFKTRHYNGGDEEPITVTGGEFYIDRQ